LSELASQVSDAVGLKSSIGYFACKGRYNPHGHGSLMDLGLSLGEGTDVHKILASLPVRQFNETEVLRVKLAESFPRWRFMLREGFSLALYGFGSKRRLLEDFVTTTLTDGGLVIANGFLPKASAKDIIASCASSLLKRSNALGKSNSPAALLASMQALPAEPPVYVVVHNIDGPNLRDTQSQDMLSQLAQCSAVRLVASMDHVDAPLLWDKRTAARFNWLWQDATTYAPYVAEVTHLPSMLLGRKVERTAKGANMVLRSLTYKAREVFRQLAVNQDNPETRDQGIPLAKWFQLCRERFLVTSELQLRTHLTEFKDHELVRTRRSAEGQDLYFIPIDKQTLDAILCDMNSDQ